jgi:hypothetical protein
MTASPAQLPFKEAIDFFKKKTRLPTAGWTDIWQQQHSLSFVVAGAQTDALITDFYNAILKAKESGTGYAQFRADFDQIVAKHGWAHNGSPGWRSRVIYDTNMTQAYNAGRWQQMWALRELRPYVRYRHTSWEHPRLEHKAWDGKVLPITDPWLDTHTPQNGWGCKCRLESLSRGEAEADWSARGRTGPDEAPPIDWQEVTVGKNSANPRTVRTPKGVDPGFAYNPGKAYLEPHTVPPMPAQLAAQLDDAWPWPPGYKPPSAPRSIPVKAHMLVPESMPTTNAVGDFLDVFGANLQNPAVFIDVAGEALVMGAGMFTQGRADYKPELGDAQFKMSMDSKEGRKKYMLLLADTVADPQEIWVSWESVRTGPKAGTKFMVRHYIKSYEITGAQGKVRYLMAIFRKSSLGWEGVTTFFSGKPAEFEKRRRGHLAYKK